MRNFANSIDQTRINSGSSAYGFHARSQHLVPGPRSARVTEAQYHLDRPCREFVGLHRIEIGIATHLAIQQIQNIQTLFSQRSHLS